MVPNTMWHFQLYDKADDEFSTGPFQDFDVRSVTSKNSSDLTDHCLGTEK